MYGTDILRPITYQKWSFLFTFKIADPVAWMVISIYHLKSSTITKQEHLFQAMFVLKSHVYTWPELQGNLAMGIYGVTCRYYAWDRSTAPHVRENKKNHEIKVSSSFLAQETSYDIKWVANFPTLGYFKNINRRLLGILSCFVKLHLSNFWNEANLLK